MQRYLPIALMVILSGLCSVFSYAQPDLPLSLQRYQLGYSYAVPNASFKYSYSETDYYGKKYDTSINVKIPSKGGFGVTMGTYVPLAKISDNARLCLGIDGVFNLFVWDMERATYDADDPDAYFGADYIITAGSMQVAVPVSLDIKTGCDAMLDKSKPTCFTFGAGIYPTFAITTFYGLPGASRIRMQPFVKTEVGFRLGICIKVRAIYVPGTFSYLSYNDASPYYDESFSFESKGTLTLSLLLMPFSWAWERKGDW